jgi:hypothetical protein
MIEITPLSQEELDSQKRNFLLEPGVWDYEILTSEIYVKEGRQSLKFTLRVVDENEKVAQVFKYLPLLDTWQEQLRIVCANANQQSAFEKGKIDEQELIGSSGKCRGKIKKGTAEYPEDKNNVVSFLENELPVKIKRSPI